MGCSPSHAVIINSSPTHETICLQPRIYMVSESTLCLLRDVGELRVYHVDDRDPEGAVEKFEGAQEQLQNPLLYHPQLRRRQRMSAGDLQSLPGPSSVGSEIESEEIKVNAGDRIEIAVDEEQADDVDDGNNLSRSGIISEHVAEKQTESSPSSNPHSVTVEVYSYKTNGDKTRKEGGLAEEVVRDSESPQPLNCDAENENIVSTAEVVATSGQNQTFDEKALEDLDDVSPDSAFAWTAETANQAMPAVNGDFELEKARVAKAQQKTTANEETVELSYDE